MRVGPTVLLLLSFTLTPAALAAPDEPAPEAPAQEAGAEDAATAELVRLDREYKAAKAAYRTAAAENRAKRKADPDAEMTPLVYPDPEYALKFRDAAKRHAGTDTSTVLLIRALSLSYRDRKAGSPAKELLAELLDEHMESERLPGIMSVILIGGFYLGNDTVRDAATRIVDELPHDDVKAAFHFALASLVNRSGDSTAEERTAAVADVDRAIELSPGSNYAERAKGIKHELLNLQVGLPAPEIEGEDLDGVAFKLSDYLGKVVVLDFWGDW